MPVINPDHLIEQATTLVTPGGAGAPRQVDLRRAISSAYYAVFHLTMGSLADEFVGANKRGTVPYAIAYRSTSHQSLKRLCEDMKKQTPPARLAKSVPQGGMGLYFRAYAAAVVELQEKRHTADYDPNAKITLADAKLAVATAKATIFRFNAVAPQVRLAFLALLAFGQRD